MTLIILCILAWNVFGLLVDLGWSGNRNTSGLEMYNPKWSYHYHISCNWFGAIMLSLLFTALCPIGAVCYWFYKLCTIKRRGSVE